MTNEQAIEYKDARIRAALATLTDLDEKTTEEQIACLDAVNTHLVEALYVKVETSPRRMSLGEFLNQPTSSPSERLAAVMAARGDSPDSQAIEQVRDRLKATSGLSGEQALVVLEDLRRILGVTQ